MTNFKSHFYVMREGDRVFSASGVEIGKIVWEEPERLHRMFQWIDRENRRHVAMQCLSGVIVTWEAPTEANHD